MLQTRRTLAFPMLFGLVLLLAQACGDDGATPGSAQVKWRVGGQSCESAGLEWVDVELYRQPGNVPVDELTTDDLYDVRRERCSIGEVRFDSVKPDEYAVKVLAYPPYKASDGVVLTRADATFEGEHPLLLVRSGVEASTPSAIVLSARKGTIFLDWKFADGMRCLSKGVTHVTYTIYDLPFSNVIREGTFECDLDDYFLTLTEEEQRNFRGVKIESLDVQRLSVEVLGFSDDIASPTYIGRQEFELEHGQVRDLVVTLERCDQDCQ